MGIRYRESRARTRHPDLVGCARSSLPQEARQRPDSVPKTCPQNAWLGACPPRVRLNTGAEPVDAASTNTDPHLVKEVLDGVDRGNKKPPICGRFLCRREPSDGLEPSTPSLPWRFRSVTRVHARSLATHILLQIGPFEGPEMRRETSCVSFLMCPFCVRGSLSVLTTKNVGRGCDWSRPRIPDRTAGRGVQCCAATAFRLIYL